MGTEYGIIYGQRINTVEGGPRLLYSVVIVAIIGVPYAVLSKATRIDLCD